MTEAISSVNCAPQNLGKKKSSVGARVAGVVVGNMACNSVQMGTLGVISPKIASNMYRMSENLSADEFQKVTDAAQKAFDISGLKDKGVKILKMGADGVGDDVVENILKTEFEKNPVARFMPKMFKEMQISQTKNALQEGKNALYSMGSNVVLLPKDNKLPLAAFHEMGHALNANTGTISKVLQKCRPATILVLPILLVALLKDKKQDGEKPQGALDKATTFVKNNAGKLAFATFLPTVLEEGIATHKGNQLAKQVLSSDLAKKVAKTNAFGLATYALAATAAGLGVFAAKKIRDAIVQGKENKQA